MIPTTPVERLGEAIAELTSRLHAATYELFVMLRQFDAQNGWNTGFMSCAHWLSAHRHRHWPGPRTRNGCSSSLTRQRVAIERDVLGGLTFVRPDGRTIEICPRRPVGSRRALPDTGSAAALRCWDGTRFNLGYVIDVLRVPTAVS
jgi:hypothetical protein